VDTYMQGCHFNKIFIWQHSIIAKYPFSCGHVSINIKIYPQRKSISDQLYENVYLSSSKKNKLKIVVEKDLPLWIYFNVDRNMPTRKRVFCNYWVLSNEYFIKMATLHICVHLPDIFYWNSITRRWVIFCL
jgi:hypothetical protein